MAMFKGKHMLELALEKEIHSYRDIDETMWPAVKLKKMEYEFIDESSEDEELYQPKNVARGIPRVERNKKTLEPKNISMFDNKAEKDANQMTKIILKDISDALSIQIPHNAVPEQQAIDFYRHGNEDTTSLMTLQNQPTTVMQTEDVIPNQNHETEQMIIENENGVLHPDEDENNKKKRARTARNKIERNLAKYMILRYNQTRMEIMKVCRMVGDREQPYQRRYQ